MSTPEKPVVEPMSAEERWRHQADRSTWWSAQGEHWPYPTHAALVGRNSDAEWLAQAFREAVSRVHEYGVKEPDSPLNDAVRRAAEADPTDELARRAVASIKRHSKTEDDDYNCEHPFCARMWPMVRAAEARARLDAARTASVAGLDPYRDLIEHRRQEAAGTHLFDEACYTHLREDGRSNQLQVIERDRLARALHINGIGCLEAVVDGVHRDDDDDWQQHLNDAARLSALDSTTGDERR